MPELTDSGNRRAVADALRTIREAIIKDAAIEFNVAAKMENLARVNELKAVLLGEES